MTEKNNVDNDTKEHVSVIEVISRWRQRFRRLSSAKVLVFIRQEIDLFNRKPRNARVTGAFARRLLLAYKVGSAITADEHGLVPFELTHCFTYRDTDHILINDPNLLSRLFLCTLNNHDFVEDDSVLVTEILSRFEIYAIIKTLNREPIHLQTKHVRYNSARGALRNMIFPKRRIPQTEISSDPIYHFSRFQVR